MVNPDLIERMTGLVTGSWATQAIGVAASLGVADHLGDRPRTADEVAAAVDADPDALYRLLRALSGLGVVEESDGRRFTLTELGGLLRRDTPESLRGIAVMFASPWHRRSWTELEECVRTGESAFVRLFDGWNYFSEHPEAGEVFSEAMTSAARVLLLPAVQAYDFGRFGTVVDVAGGHGILLAVTLPGTPGARGILFDRPEVIRGAGTLLRQAGVADRCELVGGDFFESVPAGGDAYVLSQIIHDWGDDEAVRILANCRAAMNDGGHVLLCEAVVPEAFNSPGLTTMMDLEMLVMAEGARQRTREEFEELFRRADLRLETVVGPDAPVSILDAVARS
ncbi:Mitomycin biosynthesis 6-O-methyltransferase [Streptomyces sp. RB5]|uniref:Mitomycin biosynthesis 6-O-methyltransferase n=1 Tax=Streptomyces smaragdinus TaxID=2585196 RepID=A0A7K0CBK0_9ACTN|nr:methyltransferase [Streptomyces smaragdinus]MQY10786.1 Mitomycin biosynthesis 6-O-methyltransferase [Streptomyces smaragdinus]